MTDNVFCQMLGAQLPMAVCREEQGREGCHGCTAASRLCEVCKQESVAHPREGLCEPCMVSAVAAGKCERCHRRKRLSSTNRYCSQCYQELSRQGAETGSGRGRHHNQRADPRVALDRLRGLGLEVGSEFGVPLAPVARPTARERVDTPAQPKPAAAVRVIAPPARTDTLPPPVITRLKEFTLLKVIKQAVASAFVVTVDDLSRLDRHRPLTMARQTFYLLAREAGHSLPAIGTSVGRDHSTVLYGIRKMAQRQSQEPDVARRLCLTREWIRQQASGESFPQTQEPDIDWHRVAQLSREELLDVMYEQEWYYDWARSVDEIASARTLQLYQPLSFMRKPLLDAPLPENLPLTVDDWFAILSKVCVDHLEYKGQSVAVCFRYRQLFPELPEAALAHFLQDDRVVLWSHVRSKDGKPGAHIALCKDFDEALDLCDLDDPWSRSFRHVLEAVLESKGDDHDLA